MLFFQVTNQAESIIIMTNNNKLSAAVLQQNNFTNKSIIWLHGLGADGNDFSQIAHELDLPERLNLRFIFPHAPAIPVSINNGTIMPAWFDIHPNGIHTNIDAAGIQQSVSRINQFIEDEESRGIPPENIMLAGFSQGAVIALTTGILYPKRLAGIIALSGLLPEPESLFKQASPANRDIPIFIAHGSQDTLVPEALGQAAYHSLIQAGYPAKWHSYPMAHSVCADEIADISNFIQKIWK